MSGFEKLSSAQQQVYHHLVSQNNVVIQARAGSGKTTCGIQTLVKLNKPSLVLTYNRKLTEDVKQRIEEQKVGHLIQAFTFHAFANFYFDVPFDFTDTVIEKACLSQPKLHFSFDIVHLDEIQDLTPLLYKFFLKILNSMNNVPLLIVSGDMFQMLYGYKGASLCYIREPDKHFAHPFPFQTVTLDCSWRITQEMVDYIHTYANLDHFRHLLSHDQWSQVSYDIDHHWQNGIRSTKSIPGSVQEVIMKRVNDGDFQFVNEQAFEKLNQYTDSEINIISPKTKNCVGLSEFLDYMYRQRQGRSRFHIMSDQENLKFPEYQFISVSSVHKMKGAENQAIVFFGFDNDLDRHDLSVDSYLDKWYMTYVGLTRAKCLLITVIRDFAPFHKYSLYQIGHQLITRPTLPLHEPPQPVSAKIKHSFSKFCPRLTVTQCVNQQPRDPKLDMFGPLFDVQLLTNPNSCVEDFRNADTSSTWDRVMIGEHGLPFDLSAEIGLCIEYMLYIEHGHSPSTLIQKLMRLVERLKDCFYRKDMLAFLDGLMHLDVSKWQVFDYMRLALLRMCIGDRLFIHWIQKANEYLYKWSLVNEPYIMQCVDNASRMIQSLIDQSDEEGSSLDFKQPSVKFGVHVSNNFRSQPWFNHKHESLEGEIDILINDRFVVELKISQHLQPKYALQCLMYRFLLQEQKQNCMYDPETSTWTSRYECLIMIPNVNHLYQVHLLNTSSNEPYCNNNAYRDFYLVHRCLYRTIDRSMIWSLDESSYQDQVQKDFGKFNLSFF